ncbi:MAG TPA: hypothetical protein VFO69_07400 [Allosphingosinicella sp.]|nr:hypothetical protein [Allosphingosinicella sp.]
MHERFASAVDASIEIDRFASFDHNTRRFIAYALAVNPPGNVPPQGLAFPENPPVPFQCSEVEHAERVTAYSHLPAIRAAARPGKAGRDERRLLAGHLLTAAKVDIRWKRLPSLAAALFLYERLAGSAWRELLVPILKEGGFQNRRKGPAQLPLDARLRGDKDFLKGLETDPPPAFIPSLADADAFGLPLLSNL